MGEGHRLRGGGDPGEDSSSAIMRRTVRSGEEMKKGGKKKKEPKLEQGERKGDHPQKERFVLFTILRTMLVTCK